MKKLLTLLIAGLLIGSSSLWGQTTSVTISAQSQWESTGVNITSEMTVTIEATGEWCGAPWSCYGPEGTGGIAPGAFLAPGLSSGGLVGKVGNNAPFLVGSLCSFDGQDHGIGTLYLAFNDDLTGYYNNGGTLDVTITTAEAGGLVAPYSEEPPTIDGVIGGTEWQDAQTYTLTFHSNVDQTTATAPVYFLNDGTCLYCASTVPFSSSSTAYFGIYIDGDHSHSINGTMSEPHVDIGYNKAGTNSPLYPIYDAYWAEVPPCGVLWSDMLTPPAGTEHAYSGTTELGYEFKIPLSDMTAAPGETVGIHLQFSPNSSIGYMYPSADYCDIASWPDLYIEPAGQQGADILIYSTSGTYPASSFNGDLVAILQDAGFSVTVTDRVATPTITSQLLSGYNELWVLSTNPYSGSGSFSGSEISDIMAFRDAGNGILVMADDGPPGHSYIGDANQISTPLGVTFSGEYNYGPYSQPFEPDFGPHPLFDGVQSIVCTEAAAVLSVSSPSEAVASYQGVTLIAALDDGNGRAVFDVSFARFFDGDILLGNTPQYVRNIAGWLGGWQPPEITFTVFDSEGLSPNALVRAFAQTPGSDVIADYHGYTDGFGRVTFPIEEGSAVMLNVSPENHWNEWASFDYITPRNIDVHATVQLPVNAENRVQQLTIPGPNPTAFLEAVIFACALPPELPWFIDIFPTFALSYDEDFLVFLENAAVSQGGQWVINFATVAYAHSLCYHMVAEPVVTFISSAAPTASAAATKMHSGLLPLLVVPTNILYSAYYGVSNFMTNLGYIGMVEGQSISGYCDMDLLVIDAEGNRVGSVYSNENEFVIDMNEITGAQHSGHCTHPNQIYMPANNQVHKLVVNPRSTGQYTIGFSVVEAGILRSYQVSGVFEDLSPIELSLKGFDLSNGPTAIAGSDTTIESGQSIMLDGTQSFDVDGQVVAYRWCEGSQVLSTNASFSTILPERIHQIALMVIDDDSITAITQQTIIVGSGESASGFILIEALDTLTGREVDGAIIEYGGPESGMATTSALGTAMLTLSPGGYNVVLTHPHYYPDTSYFEILANQTITEQVILSPRIGMIEGIARDTIAQMNLNGAVISYFGPENGQVLSDSSGSFEVRYLTPGTYVLGFEKDCYLSFVDSVTVIEGQSSFLAFESYQIGSLSGSVLASTVGLPGVTVDIVNSQGELYVTRVTDESGYYQVDSIPQGDYSIMLVPPLGYQVVTETQEVTIACEPVVCDFMLSELDITPQQRSRAYWAHQLHKAIQNRPKDYTLGEFSNFVGLINVHFNQNQVNPVDFYSVPQPANQADSLEVLRDLLHMRNTGEQEPFLRRLAKSELMALMLNVVSGKVGQTHEISADGRTVSQLITYCDMLVNDEITPPDNNGCPGHGSPWFRYIYASFMLVKANLGLTVPAGMIPEDVIQIAYKLQHEEALPTEFALYQNYPNPFNPTTEISFALPNAASVKLEVFNIMGQRVATLVDQHLEAGNHSVIWDGSQVASGIYFYRLDAADFVESRKMVLLK